MTGPTTAQTIIDQLGGYRAIAMAGMHTILGSDDGVQFKFRGSHEVNTCVIKLDRATDTYRMELWKITKRATSCEMKFEMDGLYADMLISTFEAQTGLYLSL